MLSRRLPGTMQGLGAALPVLLLLLLSAQLPRPAVAEQPPWAPGVERALDPSSRLAVGAARVALHNYNFHAASPSGLRALGQVRKATVKVPAPPRGGGGGAGVAAAPEERGAGAGGAPQRCAWRAARAESGAGERKSKIIIIIVGEWGGGQERRRPELRRWALSRLLFPSGGSARPRPLRALLLPSQGQGTRVPQQGGRICQKVIN